MRFPALFLPTVAARAAHWGIDAPDSMTAMHNFLRQRSVQLYLLGLVLILIGAWSMEATGSFVPMALAASAALMLSAPLVRQRFARLKAASRR